MWVGEQTCMVVKLSLLCALLLLLLLFCDHRMATQAAGRPVNLPPSWQFGGGCLRTMPPGTWT